MNKIFAITIALSLTLNSAAQQAWSLKKCIDHAWGHNITIKQQALAGSLATLNVSLAKADALPTVNGSLTHNVNNATVEEYGNPNTLPRKTFQSEQATLEANLNLWNGFKSRNSLERSKIMQQSSTLDYQAAMQNVALSVTSSYLEVLFQIENLKVQETQMAVTQEQVNRTRILVEAGSLAKYELSRLLMQQAQEKATLISVKNKIKTASLVLAQTLDLKGDSLTNFAIEQPALPLLDVVVIADVDSVYSVALGTRPEIKAKQLAVKANEADVKIAGASRLPSVYMKGTLFTEYNGATKDINNANKVSPYATQLSDNGKMQLTLGVNIPIFNKFTAKGAVQRAKISTINAQYELESEQNKLYKDVQSACADAQSAQEQYLAREEAMKLATESFSLVTEQYDAGTLSGLNFIIEKNNLAKVESELLSSKYELLFKLKLIDLLQGKSISL